MLLYTHEIPLESSIGTARLDENTGMLYFEFPNGTVATRIWRGTYDTLIQGINEVCNGSLGRFWNEYAKNQLESAGTYLAEDNPGFEMVEETEPDKTEDEVVNVQSDVQSDPYYTVSLQVQTDLGYAVADEIEAILSKYNYLQNIHIHSVSRG